MRRLQHWLGEGRGRSTDEKGVFIQTQNIIVSLKALVSVKCLNTFVHDCPSEGQLVYIVCWVFFSTSRSYLHKNILSRYKRGVNE